MNEWASGLTKRQTKGQKTWEQTTQRETGKILATIKATK